MGGRSLRWSLALAERRGPRPCRPLPRSRPRSRRRHGRHGPACRPPGTRVAQRMARHSADLARSSGFTGPRLPGRWRAPITRPAPARRRSSRPCLPTGVAYLRALEAQWPFARCAPAMPLSFLLVADADEFLTVAKLRALRRLWARVEQACGLEPKPIRLHAETAWRMTTRRDPWVNMLRTTVAAFSAGIGGADAITVLPFTAALGLPDAFARRIARNTQLILLDESNLCPRRRSGGRRRRLRGADRCALREGLGAVPGDRARGRHPGEPEGRHAPGPHRRRAGAAGEGRRHPQGADHRHERVSEHRRGGGERSCSPAPAARDRQDSRAQRDLPRSPSLPCPRSARQSLSSACATARMPICARTGTRPRVFLANLGPIAAFTARATFAKNFFEAGGIEAITNDGFSDQDKLRKPISTAKPSFAASVRRMRFTKSMRSRLPKPCDLRDRRSSIWRGARVTMKMHGQAPASPHSSSPGATPSRS